jgi:hypothetical protein
MLTKHMQECDIHPEMQWFELKYGVNVPKIGAKHCIFAHQKNFQIR